MQKITQENDMHFIVGGLILLLVLLIWYRHRAKSLPKAISDEIAFQKRQAIATIIWIRWLIMGILTLVFLGASVALVFHLGA
jgi:hypothetical protein